MDKILMLRFDVGDYVHPILQRYAELCVADDDNCNLFFYCPGSPFKYADEASYMCDDNNEAMELFFVIAFSLFDIEFNGSGDRIDYLYECLAEHGYDDAIEQIVKKNFADDVLRLDCAIEYESDTDYLTGITEGWFYINWANPADYKESDKHPRLTGRR